MTESDIIECPPLGTQHELWQAGDRGGQLIRRPLASTQSAGILVRYEGQLISRAPRQLREQFVAQWLECVGCGTVCTPRTRWTQGKIAPNVL